MRSVPRGLRVALCAALVALPLAGCGLTPRADVLARLEPITPEGVLARVESLCALGPRVNGDPAAQAASRDWIRAQLADTDWTFREQRFEAEVDVFTANVSESELDDDGRPRITGYSLHTEPRVMTNLFAERRGRERPEHWVELSAHYDTVGGSVGASDNASGVAALVELARALDGAATRDSIRLCFFTLEEQRLQGSRAHVAWLLEQLEEPGAQFRGLLNLDAVGFTDRAPHSQRTPLRIWFVVDPPTTADFLTLVGTWGSSGLGGHVEDALEAYAPELRLYAVKRLGGLTRHARRSDHANYWSAGLPAVWLTDTGEFRSPHYHQRGDTPATLDPAFLADVTRAATAWALERAALLENNSGGG